MTPIILASTSPYRKAILKKLQLDFQTDSPNIDETPQAEESAEQTVLRLASEKANAVAKKHTRGLIIGSDQLATLGDKTLGKPITHENAFKQLQACRNNTVTFLTGLSVINAERNSETRCVEVFKVHFRKLSDQQIEQYLIKEKPYNCAGSFMCEGLGISLFERLEGDDPNTLIGLPLIRLVRILEDEGVCVL
ncbi:nucleoside triphosphate pyrophosphatase [Motiliproteus sp. MSK22-1]|uniref:Maf family protein n=1 Tax=Motiliproteus sp. MSK22-1 TaxID=1897630 RepID=UPI0009773E67|nr:nucleoside triphosphate pyrophosphatase [Motiliproteus sp. MSK22-1]OMH32650.1 septum formation protein Maf [Motiliproteus sp. MSK22-1]